MKSCYSIAGMLALVTLTVGGLVAAPAPKDDRDELRKLEGDFTFTAWEQSGVSFDASRDTAKWSVKGDRYTLTMEASSEEGTIKLDPTKKPATIDLAITSGNDKGKSQVGIYKIDGDSITFCFARPGATDRPTEFKSTEENGNILVTIKRTKKE